ncbi:MAG: HAMP domain-containing sensor histidine kinase [Planctomycetota bacterium]
MLMPQFLYSLRFRLTVAFVLLISVTSVLMGLAMTQHSSEALLRMHEQSGLIQARSIAQSAGRELSTQGKDQLPDLLQHLSGDPFARHATIVDPEGKTLALWTHTPKDLYFTNQLLGDTGTGPVRPLLDFDEPMTEFVLPIVNPDRGVWSDPADASESIRPRTLGTVRLALSRQPLLEHLETSRSRILRMVLSAIALGALASIMTVRSFVRPITKLIRATALIGRGEFDTIVGDLPSRGELGALSRALTRMKVALRQTKRQLVEANGRLERKVLERTAELQAALEELQGLDRMKDEFLSSVSHEFRTPLTSIRAYAEILAKFPDEDPETRVEFLDIIVKESDRLTRLVNDVLDLVRIESGEMDWKLDQVDILELAETAMKSLRPILDEHHIRGAIARRSEIPTVRGARDLLFQVMTNLLSNAIKFSHEGDRVELSAAVKDDFVEVSVRDYGIGIDPREHRRIFDRFRQVGDTLTEKPPGTGLGLPISRNIVQRHGGEIWVESAPGQGSRFAFSLPIMGPSEQNLLAIETRKHDYQLAGAATTIFSA